MSYNYSHYEGHEYGGLFFPYTTVWGARPEYYRKSPNHNNWTPGQEPFYETPLTYMTGVNNHGQPQPTHYESWGRRAYKYIHPKPKNYGSCACAEGKPLGNHCAPGFKPVCQNRGSGPQRCACARTLPCGQCDFGSGHLSNQWSSGSVVYH
jgi:hypothetical protein